MATVNEKMTGLADAVRAKTGGTAELSIDGMTTALNNIPNKTSSDLTVNGATVTVPAGNYKTAASKSVSTAIRADTTMSVTADDTNDKLTITASNNQGAGYTSGENKTATTTITLSASGKTVTATDGTNSISKDVASGSATTPATPITANPSLATTLTSGKGYKMSVSKTQSVTPTVSAGYVSSGTAGNITVSGEAYIPQSSTGDATTSTTDTATRTIGYGQQTTIGAGYYPSARIIRNGVSSYSGETSITPASSARTFYTSGKYIDSNLTVEAIPSEYKDTTIASDEAATAEEIVMDKYAYVNGEKIRGTMYDHGAQTYALPPGATYVIPQGYHNGLGEITTQSLYELTPGTAGENEILKGKTAWTYGHQVTGTVPSQTVNSLTSNGLTVTVPAGLYSSLATKTCYDGNLLSENIKKDISIFGVTGTYEGSGGASIATCTVNISSSISINNSDFVVGATIFQDGKISTFAKSGVNYNISIPNVVCGSTIFLSVGTMSSIYGWSGGYLSSWNSESHVLYVPNTAGTYSAEIGVLDD